MEKYGNRIGSRSSGSLSAGHRQPDCRPLSVPLIFIGGAVKEPRQIGTYGSQIDIAATLLGQLGLPHEEFIFSKNMLNPNSPHFGFFTFPNAFGMMTPENEVVFNCESNSIVSDEGTHKGENLPKAKAYLQKLYDDLAKR